jgi:hypothetical protein
VTGADQLAGELPSIAGMVTTAQLSATIGQKRLTPVQRPAIAIRMPIRNMPSIESGQKASSTAHPGWLRSETPMASTKVEAMASATRTVSTRSTPRATRPAPRAWVRHSTRSRRSRPTWKSPEPSPKTTRAPGVCGSLPTSMIAADQATAPTVSTRPWVRNGWRVAAVPVAVATTSERAGAGEWETDCEVDMVWFLRCVVVPRSAAMAETLAVPRPRPPGRTVPSRSLLGSRPEGPWSRDSGTSAT